MPVVMRNDAIANERMNGDALREATPTTHHGFLDGKRQGALDRGFLSFSAIGTSMFIHNQSPRLHEQNCTQLSRFLTTTTKQTSETCRYAL